MENKITVIIPCYNEKNFINEIVDKVNSIKINKQIIVVDDCSNDGTNEILEQQVKPKVDIVLKHKKNYGKGRCINTARKYIKNDIIIIQDADLEYDPSDYLHLIHPIINGETNVVYGSRVLNKKNYEKKKKFISSYRIFGNFLLTFISNLINKQNLTDAHTCYKVFTKKIFDKIILKENGFSFCPEITTKFSNLGEKILEVPINYNGRSVEQGKKISLIHAFEAIYVLIKYKIFDNDKSNK